VKKLNPTNCDTATVSVSVNAPAIVANDDAGTSVNGSTGGTAFTNVLANDTLNGVAVVPSKVTTTFVSATNAGITLSGTNVLVAAGTPAGSYTLTYQICEVLNASNCDTAIVTVTVTEGSTLSNSACSNNGTYENAADDYVGFQINPVAPQNLLQRSLYLYHNRYFWRKSGGR